MNRQAQALTGLLVAVVLGVVVTLMATASTPPAEEQTTTSAGSPAPDPSTPDPSTPGSSSPSSPTPTPTDQPKVRLPEPSSTPPGGQQPKKTAEQRRKQEAKQRRALVPAVPELAAGSLKCIEAIAQRRTLKAATFNIHGGFGGGGLNLDDIAREISRMDADVVLLQEVDRGRKRTRRQNQAGILASQLGMNVAYDPNSGRRSGGAIGNAVLSHFPITSVRRAPLPRGGSERRGVMRVTVDIENVEVAVYVTHLEHTSARVARRQMHYIAGALRGERLPLLLGGDLNSTPDSRVLAIARGVVRDAWPEAGRGARRTVPRARIDYLLHGSSVRALRVQVVPSRISDHDAVLGGFEIGPPQACQRG